MLKHVWVDVALVTMCSVMCVSVVQFTEITVNVGTNNTHNEGHVCGHQRMGGIQVMPCVWKSERWNNKTNVCGCVIMVRRT